MTISSRYEPLYLKELLEGASTLEISHSSPRDVSTPGETVGIPETSISSWVAYESFRVS